MNVGMRVYLDTNIFIYTFEEVGNIGSLLSRCITAGQRSGARFVTSELTLSELLVKPHRDGNHALIDRYEALIQTNNWLEVQPVGRPVLAYAAALRARNKGLKLPDAVHFATAVAGDCSYFLTGDNGILESYDLHPAFGIPDNSASLQIIRPDEATLTALLEDLTP